MFTRTSSVEPKRLEPRSSDPLDWELLADPGWQVGGSADEPVPFWKKALEAYKAAAARAPRVRR